MAFDGSNGARPVSQGRRSYSRPTSAAQVDTASGLDASEHPQPAQATSKRGRKPFDFTEEVDHGILRIYNSTDVPFDTLAKASEKAGGPRKLWLRKRLTQITGTKCMDMFRLDKPSAEKRKQRQRIAMGSSPQLSSDSDTQQQPIRSHTRMSNRDGVHSWTAQLEADSTDQGSLMQTRPPSVREQAVMWKPRRPSAYSLGPEVGSAEHSDPRGSLARLSVNPSASINRTPTAPNPAKRSWTEATNDGQVTSYGAKRMQTRRVSMSAIAQGLEDMTGHTGLFLHINRISVQSHWSPRLPSSRFSWASSRRSAIGTTANSPDSPNVVPSDPVPYRPDPDYERFYHDPKPDQILSLRSEGLHAVAALMNAKAAAMSNEQAETRVLATLENEADVPSQCANADIRGVTALHLAAAYGYPRVCRYLMENGASPSSYTRNGSSVCRFARPAQDFVKNDNPLYHRILYCRQWICVGRMPPVADDTPVSPTSEEIDNIQSTAQRLSSIDGSSVLPTLSETLDDDADVGLRPVSSINRTSMPRHSLLTPLNTDTQTFEINRSSQGLMPDYHQISSYERSPISVRICREDHHSLLTPNSFSPDVVFWPDIIAPSFPSGGALSMSQQPTSEPASLPSDGSQYPNSQSLSFLSSAVINGQPISPSSYGTQYDLGQGLGSGMSSALERTNSFEWTATNDQYQNSTIEPSYTSNGYVAIQPHYPTPPIDSLPVQQTGWWQPNGDLISATSLALEQSHFPMEQSQFPNMLWTNDAWQGSSSRNDMFQPDPQRTYHSQYARGPNDQMYYD